MTASDQSTRTNILLDTVYEMVSLSETDYDIN
jgi:hypothetical protein